MPYKLSEDGLCVMKEGGETVKCHKTHEEALAHMRALMANVADARKGEWWVTQVEMRDICPTCADSMKAAGLMRINVTALKQMPEQMMQGLCEKFGDAEGFRTRCMDSGIPVDDLGAFCNWLKETCGMKSVKAGARHSTSDIKKGRGVKQKAREIVADMEDLGFPDEQQVGNPGETPGNALKAISETAEEFRCANYIVLFGGRDLEGLGSPNKNADGTRGEFFTRSTKFDSTATKTGKIPVDWEHNTHRGKPVDGVQPGDYFGYVDWKTARWDDKGIWVERVLDRRKKYVQWITELIKQGLLGNSSEAEHPVVKGANGEIKVYPLVRDTLTVQPMEPRMMTQNVVMALKALGYEFDNDGATPQATGADSAAEQSAAISTKGVIDMDEKELIALLDARDAAKAAREKAAADAEREREAKEQERIDAALKAEREKNEKEIAKLKAQYVASGRLAIGDPNGAPHQARFADTRKYDGLSPADLAFTAALLHAHKAPVSESAYKALAIKVAEDKTEETDMSGQKASLGEQGRYALKALGFEPEHFLDAAKANEVNYSTLASGGDEWVGQEYSRRLWPIVRAGTFTLQRLPAQEVPQGVESVIIPLESTDPTVYKVAQTTDENATTKTPDATVTSSKLTTSNNTLTVAKGGARTQYSGELEEDSLIPWASQLRAQLDQAITEQIEHALIDGDTATGATTNINHIGGTPTATDLYLLFNGFRKSPLVTTTANSRSGAGTLTDTDFLETTYLMGNAGLIGADITKVDFIIDPATYKKALQLASIKTRDVFAGATIENGRLTQIWNYPVNRSFWMHYKDSDRLANTAGKVDQTTVANNTTGAILAVRWDQWLFGWKRRVRLETVRVPRADITEITATFRIGLLQRDTEGSAITYNCGI